MGKGGECPNPEFVKPTLIRTSDASKSSAAAVLSRPGLNDGDDDVEDHEEAKGGMGTAMGVLIPFGLVFLAVGWVMYAYRNPHTKSGQFLIQVRYSMGWRVIN